MSFEVGDTLERIVDANVTKAGHIFKVIEYDFWGDGKVIKVVDGGFVKQPLTPEIEHEFRKIEE